MKLNKTDVSILREPIFSLDQYHLIPTKSEDLNSFIDSLYQHKEFAEAIYLASPSLHSEWEKVIGEEDGREKLNKSILKYYLRSISNTVPFGLFSTYSLDKSSKLKSNYQRFSNLDMEYLYQLVDNLSKLPIIKSVSTFHLNNTIYKVGQKLRYIDPTYENGNLSYTLSSLTRDELLDLLLNHSQKHMTFSELCYTILEIVEGVDEAAVKDYVNQLIESHFYISDFQLCLNESNLLEQIIAFYTKHKDVLENHEDISSIFIALNQVKSKLKVLDEHVFNEKVMYNEIHQELEKIGYTYNKKYVINSNLKRPSRNLNEDLSPILKETVEVLNLLSSTKIERKTIINVFRKNFYSRYENQEVPLLQVLDNELGIGYQTHLRERAIYSDLIDDVELGGKATPVQELQIEPSIYDFWMNIFLRKDKIIDLKKENLSCFDSQKNNIKNGSFPISYNYYNNKLYVKSAGGFSGASLLGRFSNNDQEISDLIGNITKFESSVYADTILAEIMHIPMSRAGNLLIRKVKRKAEINLLSKTSNDAEEINVNDLMVSIKGNRILLRSKKHNREIIPFLSSAQNFHMNSLPVYQFLCDLQSQYRFTNLNINYGGLPIELLDIQPRITYGNSIVLKKASWLLRKDQLKSIKELKHFLLQNEVPRYFYITQGAEDKIIIDRNNSNTLEILFDEIKRNNKLQITECIYDMDKEQEFAREYISVFHSNIGAKVPQVSFNNSSDIDKPQRNFIYGEEWIYFKIYTGRITANDILVNHIKKIANSLIQCKTIDKWFFLRFTDPDFHLRIRFHLTDSRDFNKVSREIHRSLNNLVDENKIWKLDLSTYKRELERYRFDNIENSESIFHIDSEFTVNLFSAMSSVEIEKSWFFILKSIDDFFNVFQIDLDNKLKIINKMYTSFWREHGSPKSVKKSIEHKFRTHSSMIDKLFDKVPDHLDEIYAIRRLKLEKLIFPFEDIEIMGDLLWSYIHMHVNRFMFSSPRFHELILYGILEKQYKKEVGKRKYLQKS